MAARETIIIDISSDEEECSSDHAHAHADHHGQKGAQHSASHHHRHGNINLYMEVTGMSRNTAIAQLLKFNQDLDMCIAAHFDTIQTQQRGNDNDNGTTTTTTTTARTAVNMNDSTRIRDNDHSINMEHQISSSSTATASTRRTHTLKPMSLPIHKLLYQPSEKWTDTVQQCKQLNVQFVDEEFPPNTTSLDGRRRQQQQQPLQNSQSNHKRILTPKSKIKWSNVDAEFQLL